MLSLVTTKIVVAIGFAIIRFSFGCLPIKLYHFLKKWEEVTDVNFINEKRHGQVICFIACCQSFGGGVLFATCFLHMMPEVYITVEELKKIGNLATSYPFSQLIICTGFFLIYFLEEVSHWFISIIPSEFPQKNVSKPNSIKVSPLKNSESKDILTDNVSTISNGEWNINEMNKNEKNLELNGYLENDKQIRRQSAIDEVSNMMDDEEIEKTKELEQTIETQQKSKQQIMRCILVELALSLHAIFEGLAIGLQTSTSNIWYLFIAVSIHSATLLFCLSVELILAHTKTKTMLIHFTALSLASPFGVLVGLLITLRANMDTQFKSVAVVLLEGLSAGTILYITFFEILNREKERRVYRLRRASFILAGFTLMAVLQCGEKFV